MKYSVLYSKLIARWPAEISIADAEAPSSTGAQLFPTLSRTFHAIEDTIDHSRDHWDNVGHWAMYQAFHQEARHHYGLGELVLKTRNVSAEVINAKILSNLQGDIGWKEELDSYEPFPA